MLLYLAEKVLMSKRTVALTDVEYGIELAIRSSANPLKCCCMNCIMGKGECFYDYELRKEQDQQSSASLFDRDLSK